MQRKEEKRREKKRREKKSRSLNTIDIGFLG
jgi:hypothetical protein